MQAVTTIGLDIAKSVFQIHGVDAAGNVIVRRQLKRRYVLPFFQNKRAAARKSSRYGHRDATMILIAYRHGLRASEICDLQWHQVELTAGRLHVRRTKRGTPSVPIVSSLSDTCVRFAGKLGHALRVNQKRPTDFFLSVFSISNCLDCSRGQRAIAGTHGGLRAILRMLSIDTVSASSRLSNRTSTTSLLNSNSL
jgi:Phage integrase family